MDPYDWGPQEEVAVDVDARCRRLVGDGLEQLVRPAIAAGGSCRRDDARVAFGVGPARAMAGRSESSPVKAGLWLALGLWLLIVVLSARGQAWSAAQEAWCYWIPSILDPYRQSEWTSPVAYVYSPAFLEVIAPLRALPWTAFVAVWTALLLGAVTYLTGLRLLWLGVLVAAAELYGGNISLLLAVAIVLGFRWPATWAFVILTKVTPGIGLLWFAVRREWRNLGIALAATVVVAGRISRGHATGVATVGARADRRTRVATGRGRPSRSRCGYACRVPPPSWCGGPGLTAAGRSPSHRCWRCPLSGSAASACSWRSSRSGECGSRRDRPSVVRTWASITEPTTMVLERPPSDRTRSTIELAPHSCRVRRPDPPLGCRRS